MSGASRCRSRAAQLHVSMRRGAAWLAVFVAANLCTAPSATAACEAVGLHIDGHAIAEVRLNGRSAGLALDPIRSVLLDRTFAQAAGFALLDGLAAGQGGTVRASGAGAAEQDVYFARDVEIVLTGHRQRMPLVPAVDLRGPMGRDFEHIDGLLGTDLFAGQVLRLDFPAACMTVLPAAGYEPAPGAIRVPILRLRDKPTIEGTLTLPDGTHLPVRFLLDFGMSGGLRLSTRFVDRHQLASRLRTIRPRRQETGLGGELDSLRAHVSRVEIGPESHGGIEISLARETQGADASPQWDALIGLELMREWRIDYDVDRDAVHFLR